MVPRATRPSHWMSHMEGRLHLTCHQAAIAQLGERQTEDLKVPDSIPGLGMLPYGVQQYCLTQDNGLAVFLASK